ncbi:MAG: chalcone isomerase family protein [Kangiellaceae bacterium]|nr:chalcone isomerase family protein [Kangiellaceae bacterium]
MNKILVLVVSCVLLTPFGSNADSLTAVDLEEVIILSPGGAELRLKGSATKSNARQAIYVGGLYLQNDSASVEELINSNGAKRFLIKTTDSVPPETIIRAINLGMTVNNNEDELEQLIPQIKKFNQIWKLEVRQGDEVCIDFTEAMGTNISVNGESKGTIDGDVFYRAFLKSWIGERPLNNSIKKQLLGIN